MIRLMSLMVAAAFALTTSIAVAADAPKADDKKPVATKADDKKPAKKKKESC